MRLRMNRREFIVGAGAFATLRARASVSGAVEEPVSARVRCDVRRLTQGPKHHFFGYYGICPWDRSGRYLVCLESDFQDRMPSAGEAARIGLVDSRTGDFSAIANTHAWNFQQGAMLHWNPKGAGSEIIYNDRRGDEIISIVLDVNTGRKRELPRPLNALSHDGRYALSLTYGRLGRLRKVVGYAGVKDPNEDSPHPDNDGVFLMDMESGRCRLVVSIRQIFEMLRPDHPQLTDAHMWFNHVVFNRTDTRFLFLARTRKPGGGLETGMFTAGLDGSDLRQVIPYGAGVSHFDWRNDRQIVATYKQGGSGRVHVLLTDGKNDHRRLGRGCLDFDGHCTFSPNGRWLATDRKKSKSLSQSLILFDMQTKQCTTLVELGMKERRFISGDLRCDFHPRWNRAADAICFDAIDGESRTRQLHIAHLQLV